MAERVRKYELRVQNAAKNVTGVAEVTHLHEHRGAPSFMSVVVAVAVMTFMSVVVAAVMAMVIGESLFQKNLSKVFLNFRLGDLAVITVVNETDEPTTLHWHGVLVPWRLEDGPQFTNTKIIEPHTRHVFEFPIRHTGTYWYHSHTEL